MRVLSPVVTPTPAILAIGVADLPHGGTVRAQVVRHDPPRLAVAFHRPLQECRRRSTIPVLGRENLEHLALVVDGPPQIARFAVDPHEHFVQMPTPV